MVVEEEVWIMVMVVMEMLEHLELFGVPEDHFQVQILEMFNIMEINILDWSYYK